MCNNAVTQKWQDLFRVTQALHTKQHFKTVILGLVLSLMHSIN